LRCEMLKDPGRVGACFGSYPSRKKKQGKKMVEKGVRFGNREMEHIRATMRGDADAASKSGSIRGDPQPDIEAAEVE